MGDQHYLYVEDDPLSRQVMQTILERGMGVSHVTILENSECFMDKVAALAEKPDVFLLDIHVEPYDGFEMLSMLRAHPQYQNARIVALTASVMSEEIEQLKSAGFDSTIAKPISLRTFPGLMERIITGEKVWHIS